MEVKIKIGDEFIDAKIVMMNGNMIVSPKVEKFKPKDGDVVTDGDGSLFIYKESLNGSNVYVIVKDNLVVFKPLYTYNFYRYATEEEKQKLFDKLKEEGYEWKPDTKELVKLKWKPKLGDDYWRADYKNFKFISTEWTWKNSTYEINAYNNGYVFRTDEECQAFCDRLNDAINSVKS